MLIFLFFPAVSLFNMKHQASLRNIKLMQLCPYRGHRAVLLSSHQLSLGLWCALLCSNTTSRMNTRAPNLGGGAYVLYTKGTLV